MDLEDERAHRLAGDGLVEEGADVGVKAGFEGELDEARREFFGVGRVAMERETTESAYWNKFNVGR